jgi:hypothetical protein
MSNLPDPLSPLNVQEIAVYGPDSCRHPITGIPIMRSANSTDSPPLSPSAQAWQLHLPYISTTFGADVAATIAAQLTAFEATGGTVSLPACCVPFGFERATRGTT